MEISRLLRYNFGRFFFTKMDQPSRLAFIKDAPEDPVNMFSDILKSYKSAFPNRKFIPMNIATMDDELGALNRTVGYRGLEDGHVVFVTEKNSRKFENLIKDPRISVTILFGMFNFKGVDSVWQVRLIGEAAELSVNQISKLWSEEPIFAKIRSRICECGKPIDYDELKKTHDKLLKEYENGQDTLPETATYTAFKIIPSIWDFYKSEPIDCIADRVQYRKVESGWKQMHVAT